MEAGRRGAHHRPAWQLAASDAEALSELRVRDSVTQLERGEGPVDKNVGWGGKTSCARFIILQVPPSGCTICLLQTNLTRENLFGCQTLGGYLNLLNLYRCRVGV